MLLWFFLFWLQMTCTVWNKCKKKKMNLWLYWLKAELALKALHWSQNAAAICCNANYFLPCKTFFGGLHIFPLLTSAFKEIDAIFQWWKNGLWQLGIGTTCLSMTFAQPSTMKDGQCSGHSHCSDCEKWKTIFAHLIRSRDPSQKNLA